MIRIIVAISKNRVIGNDNSLIWTLPNDLKRFRKLTTGSSVVMGRKTFDSIGKALPNRRNIVVTRQKDIQIENCEVVNSISEAFLLCNNDCFVIGGGEIYKQTIEIADKIYLTLVEDEFQGDTFFPELNKDWVEVDNEKHEADEKNNHKYQFIVYERYSF